MTAKTITCNIEMLHFQNAGSIRLSLPCQHDPVHYLSEVDMSQGGDMSKACQSRQVSQLVSSDALHVCSFLSICLYDFCHCRHFQFCLCRHKICNIFFRLVGSAFLGLAVSGGCSRTASSNLSRPQTFVSFFSYFFKKGVSVHSIKYGTNLQYGLLLKGATIYYRNYSNLRWGFFVPKSSASLWQGR